MFINTKICIYVLWLYNEIRAKYFLKYELSIHNFCKSCRLELLIYEEKLWQPKMAHVSRKKLFWKGAISREAVFEIHIETETYFKETYQEFILKRPNIAPDTSSKVFTETVSLISNTNLLKAVVLYLEVVKRLCPVKKGSLENTCARVSF